MNHSFTSKKGLRPIIFTVTILIMAINGSLYYTGVLNEVILVILTVVALLLTSSIRIADQWEKGVVLRMGRFIALKGPGLFFIIPVKPELIGNNQK